MCCSRTFCVAKVGGSGGTGQSTERRAPLFEVISPAAHACIAGVCARCSSVFCIVNAGGREQRPESLSSWRTRNPSPHPLMHGSLKVCDVPEPFLHCQNACGNETGEPFFGEPKTLSYTRACKRRRGVRVCVCVLFLHCRRRAETGEDLFSGEPKKKPLSPSTYACKKHCVCLCCPQAFFFSFFLFFSFFFLFFFLFALSTRVSRDRRAFFPGEPKIHYPRPLMSAGIAGACVCARARCS
jgi:hypothetical protein